MKPTRLGKLFITDAASGALLNLSRVALLLYLRGFLVILFLSRQLIWYQSRLLFLLLLHLEHCRLSTCQSRIIRPSSVNCQLMHVVVVVPVPWGQKRELLRSSGP